MARCSKYPTATQYPTEIDAIYFAMNNDVLTVHCDNCHLWHFKDAKSEDELEIAYKEYKGKITAHRLKVLESYGRV